MCNHFFAKLGGNDKNAPVKVTYWAGRGRAEPLRAIIAAAGVKADNVYMKTADDMAGLRESGKLAYGQVPLVEVDGLNLVQGMPTAIYLARKYGFYPSSDAKDEFTIGSIFASSQDARGESSKSRVASDRMYLSRVCRTRMCVCRAPVYGADDCTHV